MNKRNYYGLLLLFLLGTSSIAMAQNRVSMEKAERSALFAKENRSYTASYLWQYALESWSEARNGVFTQ